MNHDLMPLILLIMYISVMAAIFSLHNGNERRTAEIIAAVEACACEDFVRAWEGRAK